MPSSTLCMLSIRLQTAPPAVRPARLMFDCSGIAGVDVCGLAVLPSNEPPRFGKPLRLDFCLRRIADLAKLLEEPMLV